MWPHTEVYRRSLANGQRIVRIELWRDGVQIDPHTNAAINAQRPGTFSWSGGSVTATLGNRVTRTLKVGIDEAFYPWEAGDPFNPYGDELRVYAGLGWPNGGSEIFPVFRGRITTVGLPRSGLIQVSADDLAAEVALAGFEKPLSGPASYALPAGQQVYTLDEFHRLVSNGFPDAVFAASDITQRIVGQLTYSDDRGKALDDLATSVGGLWYTLADGSFTLRKVPWLSSGETVATLTDDWDGILVRATPTRSRSGVANIFRVVCERTDGAAPLTAIAEDRDPDSPINIYGPFGRKVKMIKVENASSAGQLEVIARDYIRRARALATSWDAEVMPDASLELGDVLELDTTVRGVRRSTVQVISGFTFPLGDGLMKLDLRSQQSQEVSA